MFFHVLLLIGSPIQVLGSMGVQLEGLIDLGPKWNYKYTLYPIGAQGFAVPISYFDRRKDNESGNVSAEEHLKLIMNESIDNNTAFNGTRDSRTTDQKLVTKNIRSGTKQFEDEIKKKIITNVTNDMEKFKEFLKHVIKQALKIWDDVIKTTPGENGKLKNKIMEMKKSYLEKFGIFMRQSEKHKLKTRLSSQRFILNTIETSNIIMRRLFNYLTKNENIARSLNSFQREIEREKQLEYIHACKKFGVCRTRNDFSDLLIDIINIILQTDNSKLQQALDAFTEVVKTADFTPTVDSDTQKELRKSMSRLELWGPIELRAMFVILKNVLIHKNKPLIIIETEDIRITNKTVAFQEILDTMNKNVLLSDNTAKFDEIIVKFTEWRDGTGNEVQRACESLVEVMKKGLDKLDPKTAQDIDNNLNIVMKPLRL